VIRPSDLIDNFGSAPRRAASVPGTGFTRLFAAFVSWLTDKRRPACLCWADGGPIPPRPIRRWRSHSVRTSGGRFSQARYAGIVDINSLKLDRHYQERSFLLCLAGEIRYLLGPGGRLVQNNRCRSEARTPSHSGPRSILTVDSQAILSHLLNLRRRISRSRPATRAGYYRRCREYRYFPDRCGTNSRPRRRSRHGQRALVLMGYQDEVRVRDHVIE
jgi:hypothetical protein